MQGVLPRPPRVGESRARQAQLRLQARDTGLQLGRADLQVDLLEVGLGQGLHAPARQIEHALGFGQLRLAHFDLRLGGVRGLLAEEDLVQELRPLRRLVAEEHLAGFDALVLVHEQLHASGQHHAVLATGARLVFEGSGDAESCGPHGAARPGRT